MLLNTNLCWAVLKIFIISIVISTTAVRGQESSDINASKIQLEDLQKQLEEIDFRERDKVSRKDSQQIEKGEFETTQQYEDRLEKQEENWFLSYRKLIFQQGNERHDVYRKMNLILRREFNDEINLQLGVYDADNQRFPLLLNGNFQENIFVPLNEAPVLKKNFNEAKKSGGLGLLLDEKNKAREYLIWARISFRGKTYSTDSSQFSVSRSMRVIYGNYDEKLKRSEWRRILQKFWVDGGDEDSYLPARVYAKVLTILTFIDNGVQKRILIAETAPTTEDYSCHACGLYVGIAVFSYLNGYWKIEQVQKDTGQYGSWGKVYPPDLVKVGANKYALKYESFDMGQGYEVGVVSLMEINIGIINEILFLRTHEDSTGATDDVRKQIVRNSKLTFKPTGQSEYFDLLVQTTGKKPTKIGKKYFLKPFAVSQTFRVQDGIYRPLQ